MWLKLKKKDWVVVRFHRCDRRAAQTRCRERLEGWVITPGYFRCLVFYFKVTTNKYKCYCGTPSFQSFRQLGKCFSGPLMTHNVDCLLLDWVVSLTPCDPLHIFTPFPPKLKWNRKKNTHTQAQLRRPLNNLLSQFSNNPNQCDVLSNKICCCASYCCSSDDSKFTFFN